MMNTPFNKPYLTGNELDYIKDALLRGHISGNGYYTQKCQSFFQEHFGFHKCLLTSSCTDALEMAAILIGIKPGDEVIMPSFTFVSTANAFVLRGAKIVFCDSHIDHPGIDEDTIEALITPRTKAIVPVHYAGVACDMDKIMDIAEKHGIIVVEDAAQSIDSYYKEHPLGGIGHLSCFSFHETKNVISGEGGMLVVNDTRFEKRSEIIWEKGTNRTAFQRGETDKYDWVDIGSSFLPSDLVAAFLWAQLEHLDEIQNRRKGLWDCYSMTLSTLFCKLGFGLPAIPAYATNNAHMFYFTVKDKCQRNQIITKLNDYGIMAIFHYQALHKSPFYRDQIPQAYAPRAEYYSDCLIRLPLFYELPLETASNVLEIISDTFR